MPLGKGECEDLDLQRFGHQPHRIFWCVVKRLVLHSWQMRPYTHIDALLHQTAQLLVTAHQHNLFQLTAF